MSTSALSPTSHSQAASVWIGLVKHRELIENLVMRDIKTRYKQSALGYAWAVLNPLIFAMTYALVFGTLLKQDKAVDIPFTVYVYFGLLIWNMFAIGLSTATESLIAHVTLITKVYFPREVFPISAVLSKLVDVGFGLIGLIPILLFYGVAPSPKILLALCLLPIPLLFTIGLGMLCACANLFYRDVRYVVTMVLGLMAFSVPNMYATKMISDKGEKAFALYMLNPMAVTIEAMRRLAFPQTGSFHELTGYLVTAGAVSLITFFAGYAVFKHYEPRFAEFV